jgi:DNA-binding SARP family transcriptional activator
MLSLTTFGGIGLADAGGVALAVPRRELALLALLVGAGERGFRRDQLVAYLWPETPSDSARHSLDQLLYKSRRRLGSALFKGTDPVQVNYEALSSDFTAFEAALVRAADEEAVDIYSGPFLDGFFLDGSQPFDEWVEAQRSRLAHKYVNALERLADQQAKSGNQMGALEWWRRFVSVDRLSARGALGLMSALAAAGDRAGALRYALDYEALVQTELGSPPDASVTSFERRLREHPPEVVTPRAGPSNGMEMSPTASSFAEADESGSPTATPKSRSGLRTAARLLVGLGAVAIATFAGTWLVGRATRGPPARAPDPDRILVLPFHISGGDSSFVRRGEGIMDLVASRLTGEGGPAAVDSRTALSVWRTASVAAAGGEPTEDGLLQLALELGVGQVLIGDVVLLQPDQIRISGRVVWSTHGSAGPQTSVQGAADSLFSLTDRLVSRLLGLGAGEDHSRVASLMMVPPAAVGAFLEGRTQARLGHGAVARRQFARALEYDSTFALAALELAAATEFVFQWARPTGVTGLSVGAGGLQALSDQDQWQHALEIAWRQRGQLPARDQALLLALRGQAFPDATSASEMLAGWDRALRAAPARPEVHYGLGRVLLQQGLALGMSDSRTRAAASFRAAFALDSAFVRPLAGLIEIAALEHDTDELLRLQLLYLTRAPVGDEADYVRWLVAAVTADGSELRGLRSRFHVFTLTTLDRIQRMSQLLGVRLEDAELAASLILGRANEREARQVALHRAVGLALNRGRPQEAMRLMALKRDVDRADEYQQFSLRYALLWDADATAGEEAARAFQESDALARARGSACGQPCFSLALWRAWNADTTGVAEAIARLRRVAPPQPPFGQAEVLEALLADLNGGDASAELARLDSLALGGCCSLPRFINLVSARLHERAGDLPGALAAVRRQRWLYPPEFLSTALREEGRLASLTGDTGGAIRAYRQYLALRTNPEPEMREARLRVTAALARLERDN